LNIYNSDLEVVIPVGRDGVGQRLCAGQICGTGDCVGDNYGFRIPLCAKCALPSEDKVNGGVRRNILSGQSRDMRARKLREFVWIANLKSPQLGKVGVQAVEI
jgi:hypothetical protein